MAIDPFVSVQASLTRSDPVEVLRVTAEQPGYIRLVTLPDFDGVGWRPAEASDGVLVAARRGACAMQGRGDPTTARIEVTSDFAQDFDYLPAPSPLLSIERCPAGRVRFDRETRDGVRGPASPGGRRLHGHDVEPADPRRGAPERRVPEAERGRSVPAGPRRPAAGDRETSRAHGRPMPTRSSTRRSRSSSASTAPASSGTTSTRRSARDRPRSSSSSPSRRRGSASSSPRRWRRCCARSESSLASWSASRRGSRRASRGSTRSRRRSPTRGWRSTSRAGGGCRSSRRRGEPTR